MTAQRREIPADFKPFTKGLPTRENCDLTNPYEAYLWMLVALPYQQGAQLIMNVTYLQFVSKRIWDLNGPPNTDWVPPIKYQAPLNTDPHWMSNPGEWVPADAPDRDPRRPVEKAVDGLLTQQQAEIQRELWRRSTPKQRQALIEGADDNT